MMMNASEQQQQEESNPQQPPVDITVVDHQQQPPLFDDDEIDGGTSLPNILINNNSTVEVTQGEKLKQQQQQPQIVTQQQPPQMQYHHHQQQSYSEPTIVLIPGLLVPPPPHQPLPNNNNDTVPVMTSTTKTSSNMMIPPPPPTTSNEQLEYQESFSAMTTIPLGGISQQNHQQQQQQQVVANEFLSNLSFDNNNIHSSYTTTGMNTSSGLQQQQQQQQPNNNSNNDNNHKKATISSPWQYNDMADTCYSCHTPFIPILQNKHHCRYCGYIFCQNCSSQRCMIPPSRIVVIPAGGKHVKSTDHHAKATTPSFTPDPDPDGMLTYYSNGEGREQLLYGKGLEQRIQLARQPLRVCDTCYIQLQPVQEELRNTNSNAVRYNYIDPAAPVRMLNSPVAFTLGHEIRKAAYTLNNLLPLPKRRVGAVLSSNDIYHPANVNNSLINSNDLQQCREECMSISPSLGDVDGVRIPAKLLEQAKGIAVLTVLKTGFGFAGGEVGTGLVVAKLPPLVGSDGTSPPQHHHPIRWSAPSAIGTAGLSWGALIGAQVSDHVFVLMTDAAVQLMFNDTAPSIQLGADIGIAAGPLGRSVEGDVAMTANQPLAPIYTYSLSKGLYAGVSLDGKVLVTRQDLNEKFYGHKVTAQQILNGEVPTPPAAQPLYDALARCHVYATNNAIQSATQQQQRQQRQTTTTSSLVVVPNENRNVLNEYGEISDLDTFRIPNNNNGHGNYYL